MVEKKATTKTAAAKKTATATKKAPVAKKTTATKKTTSGISTLPPTMTGTRQKTSASPQLPNCNMPRFTI